MIKKVLKKKSWFRDENNTNSLGGGEMSILRGKVFEKAGVNISTVYGPLSKELKGKFWFSKFQKFLGFRYFSDSSHSPKICNY